MYYPKTQRNSVSRACDPKETRLSNISAWNSRDFMVLGRTLSVASRRYQQEGVEWARNEVTNVTK